MHVGSLGLQLLIELQQCDWNNEVGDNAGVNYSPEYDEQIWIYIRSFCIWNSVPLREEFAIAARKKSLRFTENLSDFAGCKEKESLW